MAFVCWRGKYITCRCERRRENHDYSSISDISSISYIESAKKWQNVETVTILRRMCHCKISKSQFFKNISLWHFFVENVFFAFLLWYDDPNQLLYLGCDYVRSNVVNYTENLTLGLLCCVVLCCVVLCCVVLCCVVLCVCHRSEATLSGILFASILGLIVFSHFKVFSVDL